MRSQGWPRHNPSGTVAVGPNIWIEEDGMGVSVGCANPLLEWMTQASQCLLTPCRGRQHLTDPGERLTELQPGVADAEWLLLAC